MISNGVWQVLMVLLSISSLAMEQVNASERLVTDLTMRNVLETSDEPLTTEKAWTIDPGEKNPHRLRWLLGRELRLEGLRAVARGSARASDGATFGVEAAYLDAKTTLFVRADGPWYRNFLEFSCNQEPDYWFSTREGAIRAGEAAAKVWERLLDLERSKLLVMFRNISAATPEVAMQKAQISFQAWRQEIDSDWRLQAPKQARAVEWKFYSDLSASMKLGAQHSACKRPGARAVQKINPPWWDEMMEPVKAEPARKFLVRAPARRWSGLFSIRVNLNIGAINATGQFLIDSGAPVSIVSPAWLQSQGVSPSLIELKGVPPIHTVWSGGQGMARPVLVQSSSVSGLVVPIRIFWQMDTELFFPPAFMTSCCDGVLGADFLRQYAVEFLPGPPTEVRLWPRSGFQLGTDTPWVEVSVNSKDELISHCIGVPQQSSGASIAVPDVRWDTGNEMALEIHNPWQGIASKWESKYWKLTCGTRQISNEIPVVQSKYQSKYPGLTAGMSLLGRGPFTLDLAHGRIWFSKESFAKPIPENRSGLEVEYFINKSGDRALRVTASSLHKMGLKRGVLITEIDSRSVDELDIWEVEQRLSGVYGNTVHLTWKTYADIQQAELKLTPK